ncbi:hypothetical protein BD289DRAFT_438063 [Coniella lustricola]|uniref:DUF1746 domain-containing protein n=1 Tax=Coniella lustricola TaxID=2025994 RepID=A0A2T3A3F4_9PEZI|nr:hypothetical protein BD289DRAFT_438063 [Coniella lustricola]
MSNDPTAARDTARLPTRDDDDDDTDNDSDATSTGNETDNAGEGSSSSPHNTQQPRARSARRRSRDGRRRRSSSRMRRAKAGIARKLDFMTHLMSSLDVVIFAELCVLYYMDCSFTRLVMRSFVQYMYLTPKPEDFLRLMPAPRPQIYAIFASNITCVLLHLFFALPQANETMRGYLHGAVIIDLIGQKAPTSRLGLVLLDCLVLLLQCVMCAVLVEKDRLKKLEITLRRVSAGGFPKSTNVNNTAAFRPTAAVDAVAGAHTDRQDLDSEERGVLRDDALGGNDTNDIEMRPLANGQNPTDTASGGISGMTGILEARYQRVLRTLAGSQSTEGADRPSMVDVLMSGNGLLANLHVVHVVRTLATDHARDPGAAAYSLQLTGYTSRLAAIAARSRRRAGPRQQGNA